MDSMGSLEYLREDISDQWEYQSINKRMACVRRRILTFLDKLCIKPYIDRSDKKQIAKIMDDFEEISIQKAIYYRKKRI